jgi:hypothetical protein
MAGLDLLNIQMDSILKKLVTRNAQRATRN